MSVALRLALLLLLLAAAVAPLAQDRPSLRFESSSGGAGIVEGRVGAVGSLTVAKDGGLTRCRVEGNVFAALRQTAKRESVVLQLMARRALDREIQSSVDIAVTCATTLGSVTRTLTVPVVDVNDNAPRFLRPGYEFRLAAPTDDLRVGQVSAHDSDAGPNSQIEYRLDPAHHRLIAIDRRSGLLRLLAPLRRQWPRSVALRVIAVDGSPEGTRHTAVATVTVFISGATATPGPSTTLNQATAFTSSPATTPCVAAPPDPRPVAPQTSNSELEAPARPTWIVLGVAGLLMTVLVMVALVALLVIILRRGGPASRSAAEDGPDRVVA